MTPAATTTEPDRPSTGAAASDGQSLVRRVRLLAGLGVSAVIFWYVGWWAAHPTDPAGPVALLLVDNGVIAMAELLGIAIAAAGLAVAVCGRGSSHHGPFAVAVGLAALGLRGGQMDALVGIRLGDAELPAVDAVFPTHELIAETWLWLALVAVGFVVGRWVESWHDQPAAAPSARKHGPVDSPGEMRQGLGAAIVISLVAYTALGVAAGRDVDEILKGQVYFAVGVSFMLGAALAQWLFRSAGRIWGVAAIAVVAPVAYYLNGPDAAAVAAVAEKHAYLVLAPAARVLPIEFAALGTIGTFVGFALGRRMQAEM